MNNSRPRLRINPHLSRLGVATASLACVTLLFSQDAPPPPQMAEAPQQQQNTAPPLSPESLNQLLAPIALYPDALIALILPASTVPSDIVLASRFLSANGDPKQASSQPWDPSVQSLAAYPDVLTWMDQNLQWTTSLGQAFLSQPADVMNAIQQLRSQAKAAGNLVDTPQQKVVQEERVIRIVPSEPEYIYPPQYDPEVVYVQPYSQDVGPLVTFGIGFAVGSWLNYDCDWEDRRIYRGDWQPGWDYNRHGHGGHRDNGNVVNVVNINENTAQVWRPSARSQQQLVQQQQRLARTSNVQAASGVTAANAQAAGTNRLVPRPSQPRFDKHNGGKRDGTARNQPPAVNSQQAPVNSASSLTSPTTVNSDNSTTVVNPSTPPNVPGQKGKPLKGPNAVNQNGNKPGNHPNRPQPNATTVDPTTVNSNQVSPAQTAPTAVSPTEPVQPKKDQGKHNNQPTTPPAQVQPAPAVTSPQTSAPSATAPSSPNNKGNKNNHKNQPNTSTPQAQSQPAPAPQVQPSNSNKHHSSPQAPPSAPQQAPVAQQQKHNSPPRETKPAPAPQKQQAQPQKQQPQPQKQQPQPQKQQAQPQKQQPQQHAPAPQPQKHQEQKAAPAPQKQAPAASAPQGKKPSSDKKSDKKNDNN